MKKITDEAQNTKRNTKQNIGQNINQSIREEDNNITIRRWFKRRANVAESLLQRLLRRGLIRLDGKKIDSTNRISTGQILSYPPMDFSQLQPKKIASEITKNQLKKFKECIIHEDENLVAINKPAGLASQGGKKQYISVDSLAHAYCKGKMVHRLDKSTSGVMVIAKNAAIAAELGEAFKTKKGVEKTYLAIIHGKLPRSKGEINIGMSKERGVKFERMKVNKNLPPAITQYQLIRKYDKIALVMLKPITGRTHQLRLHMSHINCPIIGDDKYGSRNNLPAYGKKSSLMLHSYLLNINTKNISLNLTSQLPEIFKQYAKSYLLEINADEVEYALKS